MADVNISWKTAYQEREDLGPFGSAGLGLFAMALKFGYDDLVTIGADAVVDGKDDRGCDLVFIDRDQDMAIIAQTYRADTPKIAAQAGKAASLRQALSYLLEVDIDKVPERIRASAAELRAAIAEGDVKQIHVWFVHNCPGSDNVRQEIDSVKATAKSILNARFKDKNVQVFSEEIDSDILQKLYSDTNTPILVSDTIEFEAPSALEFDEGEWRCLVVPLSLRLLQSLYHKHRTDLFSANVRDFLGVKASDSNINFAMQKSLKSKPDNFFVYNNGLTVLTHRVEQQHLKNGRSSITVSGLSIVNGAQTTGTIGNFSEEPPENAYVLARFISTSSTDLIADVVRYNNSQNAVTASDFRSTDPTQRRLVEEMKRIPDAEYDGGRRGGVSAAIKRRPKLLPSYSVGQALAALHGLATVAYNEKSAIWSRDALYSRFFNDSLTAPHVVFAYSLLRAIEIEKNDLRQTEASGTELSAADKAKLAFYRRRGSVFLLVSAIGECLETITDKVLSNRFEVSFGLTMSPDEAVRAWSPVVRAISGLHVYLEKAFSDGLKNQERVAETITAFSQLVASLRLPYAPFFDPMKDCIVIGQG